MKNSLFLFFILCISNFCIGQEMEKWRGEIDKLNAVNHDLSGSAEVVVLSGSSSARFWKDIHEQFPNKNIINTGFGGSQMHELEYFIDELIIQYKPSKVFIYEGDNDIALGKSAKEILKSTKSVVRKIRKVLPYAKIYFISPKPSLARWDLKDKYLEVNMKIENFCERKKSVEYIDVWFPMLDEKGEPKENIFIGDGLHMNPEGYKIWASAVQKFINS